MSLSTDDVFVQYECDECAYIDTMTVAELITGGNPLCQKCHAPYEMLATGKILIPEHGDEI